MGKEKPHVLTNDEKIIARISELREALGMWPNSTLEQMVRRAQEMSTAIRDHAHETDAIKSEADAKVASALQAAEDKVRVAQEKLESARPMLLQSERTRKAGNQLLGH